MKLLLLYISLFITVTCAAQLKYDANWVFGDSVWLDFRDPANPVIRKADCDAFEMVASISSDVGEPLFYFYVSGNSNPYKANYGNIKPFNGYTVSNGDSILGYYTAGSSTEIIPVVDSSGLFMLLHLAKDPLQFNCGTFCYSLYYTLIRITGQQIVVEQKNTRVSNQQLEEHIAVTKAANGRDWWVVAHEFAGDDSSVCNSNYLVYKIVGNRIALSSVQSIGFNHCMLRSGLGEYSFSRDGSRLACPIFEAQQYTATNFSGLEVLDFDRCTGLLSNNLYLSNFNKIFGCSFSPNGNYLYISEYSLHGNLYRFRLDTSDISGSKSLIWYSGGINFGPLELSPNNELIVARYSPLIDKIVYPDSSGPTYEESSFDFTPAFSTASLPSYPNYNLSATSIYQADAGADTSFCLTEHTKGVTIGSDSVPGVTYHWLIDSIYNSAGAQQLVRPDTSTWYYLEITDTTIVGSCNSRIDSVFVEVRNCTGIEEPEPLNIRLYPNPANRSVFVMLSPDNIGINSVETSALAGCHLELYNLMGQQVLNQPITAPQTTIPLNLPEGVYIYKVLVEGTNVKTGKLVVAE